MNKKILVFNAIYYFITFSFVAAAMRDPSSSLGDGIFIAIFWAIAGVVLLALLFSKCIIPKTVLDKIGIFTATPFLCLLAVTFIVGLNDESSSEGHNYKNNYQWKEINVNYGGYGGRKRIEYYRSAATSTPAGPFYKGEWVKDSTWLYFSEKGDTIKKVRYKNGIEQR